MPQKLPARSACAWVMRASVQAASQLFNGLLRCSWWHGIEAPRSSAEQPCNLWQVIAGATEGQVGLLLVNAPNGGNGMADGLNAIADWTGGTVSCVSLSWGRDEGHWADELIDSTEEALKVSKFLHAQQTTPCVLKLLSLINACMHV